MSVFLNAPPCLLTRLFFLLDLKRTIKSRKCLFFIASFKQLKYVVGKESIVCKEQHLEECKNVPFSISSTFGSGLWLNSILIFFYYFFYFLASAFECLLYWLTVNIQCLSSVPMSFVPTGYWLEAFCNGFSTLSLDKHAGTLAQIIVWAKLRHDLPETLLRFLKFLHRLRSEEQGESNIVRKPNQRLQTELKKFLKYSN